MPEYGVNFGSIDMYIHVEQGLCVDEWVLLNTFFSLAEASIPFPYSFMFSAVSEMLLQEHPGAQGFSGLEIFLAYIFDVAKNQELVPKNVSTAISILFTCDSIFDSIFPELSCTSECYNVQITMLSKETLYDCHSIRYHFFNDEETIARGSEYDVDGIQTIVPSVNYYDHVNNRDYLVYGSPKLE